jgi:hypothetical protein
VLLARRFLEAERDAQSAPYAANFDGGSPVALAGWAAEGEWTMAFEAADAAGETKATERTLTSAERAGLRAPGRPGFFTVRRGETVVLRGGAQFADVRQGDFRAAETFAIELRGELERHTRGDPFVVVWLAALAALTAASWRSATGSAEPAPGEDGRRTDGARTGRDEGGAAIR